YQKLNVALQLLNSVLFSEPVADLRVVLVGQERVGKSSAGNTILGRKEFNSELSLVPLTLSSKRAEGEFMSRRVSVVDTPGLSSSVLPPEQVKAEIQRAVELSSPGPHVFLLTIKLGRFTEQEQRGLEKLQEILGPKVFMYIMILFTYGDRLEKDGINIDEFVQRDKNLQKLVRSCSGMYYILNNQKMENRKQVQDLAKTIVSLRDVEDSSQVNELLKKIDRTVQQNGGGFYTIKMLEEAERENSFIWAAAARAAVGAAIGAAGGAAVGAAVLAAVGPVIGPMGSDIGAAVGGSLGSSIVAAVGASVAVLMEGKTCIIQ
ncbi:GTPase IMAP family member 9-like, partial [Poeciliopsis prolifica]|uniref:GTPase IMAP family member 9-like n=1 Tax=Poeciliopsis prolifica TaxID=188132 RepID=UPI002413B3B3